MAERFVLLLIVLGGLALVGLGWRFYKVRLIRQIRPAESGIDRPTLLYFSADYCPPCKLQQAPIIERLAAKLGGSIMIKKYDVTEHPELARRYKVLTLPTTVVLNGQGQVAHVNYGLADQARLENQLGRQGC